MVGMTDGSSTAAFGWTQHPSDHGHFKRLQKRARQPLGAPSRDLPDRRARALQSGELGLLSVRVPDAEDPYVFVPDIRPALQGSSRSAWPWPVATVRRSLSAALIRAQFP